MNLEFEFHTSNKKSELRGPSPFHFVKVLADESKTVKAETSFLSYGWGIIPIQGEIEFNLKNQALKLLVHFSQTCHKPINLNHLKLWICNL